MRIAETVTFGGSGLDRAAHLRPNADAHFDQNDALTIVLWRGKPMICGDDLVRLPCNHPLALGSAMRIFLGQDGGSPLFAVDVSDWEPEALDSSQMDTFLDLTAQHHPDMPEDQVFLELRSIMTRLSNRDAEIAATAKGVLSWHGTHRFCARCGAESRLAQGGWQRDCPACGAHHFPRTDPVVIMLITHGNSVLLGRSPGWPDGMYSLLAGFIEPGETMEAAVRREVFEESGVRVGPVGYLASQPWPFPASLMFGCWGEATTKEITLDPNELEDALWLTREELADVFAGQHPKVLPARRGAIAHFLLENWLADRLD